MTGGRVKRTVVRNNCLRLLLVRKAIKPAMTKVLKRRSVNFIPDL